MIGNAYVRQWFSDRSLEIDTALMFFAGIIAGWTNENNICWFILVGSILCRKLRAEDRLRSWAVAGLLGMSIGYALLIFAPGNFNRAVINTDNAQPLILEDAITAGLSLGMGFVFELLMWYFLIQTLMRQEEFGDGIDVRRSLIAAKTFAIVSALSSVILLLSPEFALRSLFPGLRKHNIHHQLLFDRNDPVHRARLLRSDPTVGKARARRRQSKRDRGSRPACARQRGR